MKPANKETMLHLIGGNIVVVLQSFLVAFHSDWIVFPENVTLQNISGAAKCSLSQRDPLLPDS